MATPPPPSPPIDLVAALAALYTWLLGANAAALLAPWSVIVLSALLGAGHALGRDQHALGRGAWWSLWFLAQRMAWALLFTVPIAELASRTWGLEMRWVLGPAAALIAARPEWAIAQVRGLLQRRGGRKG